MLREGAAVAGLEFFQPLAPVAAQRLISGYALIAPRSVWIAVNGSDLSATTFMVSSKMDGSDLHL